MGPGAISQVRSEEKPKGTEQLESLHGDGGAGAAASSNRGALALQCSPRATPIIMRRFSKCFFSSSMGIYFLHTSYKKKERMKEIPYKEGRMKGIGAHVGYIVL